MPAVARPASKTLVGPLPADEALPELACLLDDCWLRGVWSNELSNEPHATDRIARRQLLYRPGSQAVLSCVAEQKEGERWVLESPFAVEVRAGEQARAFSFPHDPYLPGLAALADAGQAQELLPRYVALHPQRLRVETVRYRPTRRAVLRYETGFTPRRPAGPRSTSLFARAMRPARVARLTAAAELAQHSGFGVPRIVGTWPEGGAVWMADVPGATVRSLIGSGEPPAVDSILDSVKQLWAAPSPESLHGFTLKDAFRSTDRLLSAVLRNDDEGLRLIGDVRRALQPFVDGWRRTAPSHNDFYDDQIIVDPEGRLFLVDFEEAGPGDPLLDIGNFLAHMRWMSCFRSDGYQYERYGADLRERSLQRFSWSRADLSLREAFALFRLATNPIRKLQRNWPARAKAGLRLALETLEP